MAAERRIGSRCCSQAQRGRDTFGALQPEQIYSGGAATGICFSGHKEIRRGVRELAIALEEEKQDSHLQASRCSPLSDANCRVTLTTLTYFSFLQC